MILEGGKILCGFLAGAGLAFILAGCFERMSLPERDGLDDLPQDDVFQEDMDAVPDRPDAPDQPDDAAREDAPTDDGEDVEVDTMICSPGEAWCTPEGGMATCTPDGTSYDEVPCPLGCTEAPAAHCLALVPSNVGDPSLLCVDGTADLELPDATAYVSFNTVDGTVTAVDATGTIMTVIRNSGEGLVSGINFRTVAQPVDDPVLGVFSFDTLTVPAGVTVLGTGRNALVILSCTDVNVQGRLGADAVVLDTGTTVDLIPGAGGGDTQIGPGAGATGVSGTPDSGGGGGGGFGGAGGQGGVTASFGGAGGPSYGNAELVPLLGGSGGGTGADNDAGGGLGGASGGALQISAGGTLHVFSGGAITANGLGGQGSNPRGAGGGGGSGGGVLLEAASIAVDVGGFVVANGGGGGASTVSSSGVDGEDGQPGQAGTMAAPGGVAADTQACSGGNGNSSDFANGVDSPSCAGYNGGGGGGGAGRIRLNAPSVSAPSGTVSPDLSTGATTTGLPVMQ